MRVVVSWREIVCSESIRMNLSLFTYGRISLWSLIAVQFTQRRRWLLLLFVYLLFFFIVVCRFIKRLFLLLILSSTFCFLYFPIFIHRYDVVGPLKQWFNWMCKIYRPSDHRRSNQWINNNTQKLTHPDAHHTKENTFTTKNWLKRSSNKTQKFIYSNINKLRANKNKAVWNKWMVIVCCVFSWMYKFMSLCVCKCSSAYDL